MPYTCKDCFREFADDPAPDPRDEAVRVLREALAECLPFVEMSGWSGHAVAHEKGRAALAATEPKK